MLYTILQKQPVSLTYLYSGSGPSEARVLSMFVHVIGKFKFYP